VSHTTNLKNGESITYVPNGHGVKVIMKTRMLTIVREVDCNEAASLLFGLEQALEASACERIRAEVTA